MTWNWQDPDWPNWRYDVSALEALERQFLLASGQLKGLWSHVAPGDQEQLTIDLLSGEALKTSAIEGEILNRESVQSSVRREFGLKADRKAGPAEAGIAALMVKNFHEYRANPTHDMLYEWHRLVCQGRTDLKAIGAYRNHKEPMQIVSGALHKPKVHFEAVPSADVPKEMDRFLKWFASSHPTGEAALPPLTRAGLAHLYFESIHPFEDGNGRIGRALSEQVLAQALGQPSLVALSHQIAKDRKHYYAALEANNKDLEITYWLVWFAETILAAQQHSIALFEHLIAKTKMLDRLRGQLNERQERALIRLFDAGPEGFVGGLSAGNYQSITGTVTATATRDLADLVEKGALKRTGERKGTRYWLNL